jgi:hypothetical protein
VSEDGDQDEHNADDAHEYGDAMPKRVQGVMMGMYLKL